jgi:hypothetical protein
MNKNKGGGHENSYSSSILHLGLHELVPKSVGHDCHQHHCLFDAFRHHLVNPDANSSGTCVWSGPSKARLRREQSLSSAKLSPSKQDTTINDKSDRCRDNGDALDISIWENEGGASGPYDMKPHYGRRIEPDGSWTVIMSSPAHRRISEADRWLGSAKPMPRPK